MWGAKKERGRKKKGRNERQIEGDLFTNTCHS